MAKPTPEGIALLKYLDKDRGAAKMMGLPMVADVAGLEYGVGINTGQPAVGLISVLTSDGYITSMQHMIQGTTEPRYELKITTKGGLAVQSDRVGDTPRSQRIADKFRELAKLFDEEQS